MNWWLEIKDINGIDLLEEFNIPHSLNGLAPQYFTDTSAKYYLYEIRDFLQSEIWRKHFITHNYDVIFKVKRMLLDNLACLRPHRCPDCRCEFEKPEGWNMEVTKNFLKIPNERIYSVEVFLND